MLSLTPDERARGVVAASSGNHGAAVAYGLRTLNASGTIFVPTTGAPTKIDAIRRLEATVELIGTDCLVTEIAAREYADRHGMTYVSPYNDWRVIAGQGTIGIEIIRQCPQVDAVFVPIGGGGLIAGIAGYLKSINPRIRIIGCLPSNSPIMAESIRAGHIVDMESFPTLSDATAGGLEPGAITFDLCRALVDDYVTVSEDEIKDAMRQFIGAHHMLIEGAAGVGIASFLQRRKQFANKNVVIVICGANIGLDTLRQVLV